MTSPAGLKPTLALVEVILAQAVGYFWLRQKVTNRQLLGMAVIVIGVALLLRTEV